MQAELAEEDPSLLSEARFLSQPLTTSGLHDCLQFQRQTSMDATGLRPAPLAADPEAIVTDADKEVGSDPRPHTHGYRRGSPAAHGYRLLATGYRLLATGYWAGC